MADRLTTFSSTLHSGATATGNGTLFDCGGLSTVAAQVSGTFSATVTWEATVNETDWVSVNGTDVTTLASATTATAAAVYLIPLQGFSQFRARISTYVSGQVTVRAKALQGVSGLSQNTLVGGLGGSVAHDSADSGNPVKVGSKALDADPTAVAASDRVNYLADLVGRQVVFPYALPQNFVSGKTAAITGTSDTEVIAAQGAGVRVYVTSFTVTNSHATVNTEVLLKDGTTELLRVYVNSLAGTAGPQTVALSLPAPLRLTANTALNAANITTGANVFVSAQGFKSAV